MGVFGRRGAAGWGRFAGVFLVFVLLCGVVGGSVAAQVTAPSAGEALDEVWVLVDDTLEVDVSSAFVGTVDSYSASSGATTTATVSTSGSTVSVTGVAAGTATISVTATNTAGSASGSLVVVVLEADDPPLARGYLSSLSGLVAGGSAVEVDASKPFAGPVDSYEARIVYSSRTDRTSGPVASVSLSGSTVTISPIAAGLAYVTVTAANTHGSAYRDFSVTVTAAPTPTTTTVAAAAPTANGTLAAQTVTAGASVDVDVVAAFTGTVDSYSATSSDDTNVTVSVSGSVVTLTGVAAGTATVTITATNTTGSATQTLGVTVNPAAPVAVGSLAAQTVSVNGSATVDVASGFAGTVDSYSATSSDTSVLTVSTSGSAVTLTGVVAGEATVAVTATNTTGSVSQSFAVTVNELTVTATAPTYCLTDEGRPVLITAAAGAASTTTATGGSTVGREGVATVDVSYTISGGRGPYVVTNPGTAATGGAAGVAGTSTATGTVTVSCALAGVNLANVAATTNVVEAGPKTIILTVTDADSATATTTLTVQVAEDVYTTGYNEGIMRAGRSYVLGTSSEWALITLPTGLDLRFDGVSEVNGEFESGYFVDTVSGSLIVLDWGTGAEVHRKIVAPTGGGSTSGSSAPARNVAALFDTLTASASTPDGATYDGGALATDPYTWRPYEGLPSDTKVTMHENMLKGETLIVCNAATADDFYIEDFDDDEFEDGQTPAEKRQTLLTSFNTAFGEAIDDWNAALHREDNDDGTQNKVFQSITQAGNCDSSNENSTKNSDVDIIVHKRKRYDKSNCDQQDTEQEKIECRARYEGENLPKFVAAERSCKAIGGCAWRVHSRELPVLDSATTYHTIITRNDSEWFRSTIAHELGHFLGSGDYKQTCLKNAKGIEDTSIKSLYTYKSACRSPHDMPIADRDRDDMHKIYHPDKLVNVRLENGMLKGDLPKDTMNRFEFNAYFLVAWSRSTVSGSSYSYLVSIPVAVDCRPTDSSNESDTRPVCDDVISSGSFEMSLGGLDPAGREFLVAGVTRGDHHRLKDAPAMWAAHWEVPAAKFGSESWVMGRSWTLGVPTTVSGPALPDPPEPTPTPTPTPPATPSNLRAGTVTTSSVALSWDAVSPVTRYDVRTTRAGSSSSSTTSVGNATSYTVPNLSASTSYSFAVRAVHGTLTSGWSTAVDATTDEVDDLPPPLPISLQVSGKISVRRIAPRGTQGYTLEYSFTPTGGTRILPASRYVVFDDLETTWKRSSVLSGPTSQGTRDFGRILTRRTTSGGDRIEVAFRPVEGSDILPTPNRFKSYSAMTINTWYSSSRISFLIPLSSGAADGSASDDGDMLAGDGEGCVECSAAEGEMDP